MLYISTADNCNATFEIEDNEGHLQTENYPGLYSPNCEWTAQISTQSRYSMSLTFEGFSLGDGDYIEVLYTCLIYSRIYSFCIIIIAFTLQFLDLLPSQFGAVHFFLEVTAVIVIYY